MGEATAVNFFGHAHLASERSRDAGFVFGAMLPDLAAMAGLRVERVAHATAEAGCRFHHATDAAFHRSASFRRLLLEASGALAAAGVRRGPARALGHVGVELLLDRWLAEQRGVPARYVEALAAAPALARAVAFRGGAPAGPLVDVCGRVAAASAEGAAGDAPERLAERLARTLARRPRLALAASELPAVVAWAAGARAAVGEAAPGLLAELAMALPAR